MGPRIRKWVGWIVVGVGLWVGGRAGPPAWGQEPRLTVGVGGALTPAGLEKWERVGNFFLSLHLSFDVRLSRRWSVRVNFLETCGDECAWWFPILGVYSFPLTGWLYGEVGGGLSWPFEEYLESVGIPGPILWAGLRVQGARWTIQTGFSGFYPIGWNFLTVGLRF
ncbi:hypothetical protein HRbin11_01274 [bacterium HR11]|nr:hypothetical protein HRbin11_01274 [bacterium HR11]